MSMADMYWDQPTDLSQEEPDEQSRTDDSADDAAAEAAADADDVDQTPEGQLRHALSRVVLDDAASWRKALKDAGFSDEESRRLIFERLRPRGEGRTRATEERPD